MSCEDIKDLLDEYITGELDENGRAAVEEHLSFCVVCRNEYDELKALKNELKELTEKVPEGFEERLNEKIKKEEHRIYLNVSRFGISVAAAVVLICVISIGYGTGHNQGLDDRLNGIGSGWDTAKSTDQMSEEYEEPGVAEPEQNDTVKETEAITEYSEITNITADVNVNNSEITTEPIKYTEVERAEERESVEVQAQFDNTVEDSGIAAFKQPAGETVETSSEVQADFDSGTEEVTESNSVMMKRDLSADTDDDGKARLSGGGGLEAAAAASTDMEVKLRISGDEMDALKSKLDTICQIKNIRYYDDTVAAEVEDMSYEDLKTALGDFHLTEESIYIDETSTFYSILITIE